LATKGLSRVGDIVLWYAKDLPRAKLRKLYSEKLPSEDKNYRMLDLGGFQIRGLDAEEQAGLKRIPDRSRVFRYDNLTGQGSSDHETPLQLGGKIYYPPKNTHWKANYPDGMMRLLRSNRLHAGGNTVSYKRYLDDYLVKPIVSVWMDTGVSGFSSDKLYVVQTLPDVIKRCILMTSDPGDIVFDPTCGSGTTAYVAEQWGRRWITIDTSRVSLALARSRIMGARYPYYLLADSPDGKDKEQDITGAFQPDTPTRYDIRHGFVYERAPHITLKSIANNAEIDVIWENCQEELELLRERLNSALGKSWEEWEIRREVDGGWSKDAKDAHAKWWELRIARQAEIDKSIAQKADVELLYDRPYEDNSKVRVAGPFTVESLSPHRVVPADEEELIDLVDAAEGHRDRSNAPQKDFTAMILENLKSAGVHQAAKEDRISFNSIDGWPGTYIAAEGYFQDGGQEARSGEAATGKQQGIEKRAAIFVGPEFGTVTRADLTAAAREANDARFDVLIACGFNFDAHSSELTRMGPLPILKAKMNQDLHMSDELKNTGKGNLFTIIGEPDIDWNFDDDGNIVVEVLGLDVFDLRTSEVRASEKDDIAAWFIDTDYNEESFFVRHAYFLGANDPYKALKTSLKAEIDKEAWESLYRDVSRPFPKPETGRFAVKVINHFGDEVMKVFSV
ncbi:MAG: DNA methyltransferase, partial [Rhodospirillaceae bacterium]